MDPSLDRKLRMIPVQSTTGFTQPSAEPSSMVVTPKTMREYEQHVATRLKAGSLPCSSISSMLNERNAVDLHPDIYRTYLAECAKAIKEQKVTPSLYQHAEACCTRGAFGFRPSTNLFPSVPGSSALQGACELFDEITMAIAPPKGLFDRLFRPKPEKIPLSVERLQLFRIAVHLVKEANEALYANKINSGEVLNPPYQLSSVETYSAETARILETSLKQACVLSGKKTSVLQQNDSFFSFVKKRMSHDAKWAELMEPSSKNPKKGDFDYFAFNGYIVPDYQMDVYVNAVMKALVYKRGMFNEADDDRAWNYNQKIKDNLIQSTYAERQQALSALGTQRLYMDDSRSTTTAPISEVVLVERFLLHMCFLSRHDKGLDTDVLGTSKLTAKDLLDNFRRENPEYAIEPIERDTEGLRPPLHMDDLAEALASTRAAILVDDSESAVAHREAFPVLYPQSNKESYPSATSKDHGCLLRSMANSQYGRNCMTPEEKQALSSNLVRCMHQYTTDHVDDAAIVEANVGMPCPVTDDEVNEHVQRAIKFIDTKCKEPHEQDELVTRVALGSPVLPPSSKLYDVGGLYDSAIHGYHAVREGWSQVHDHGLANMMGIFSKALVHSKSNRSALRTALGLDKQTSLASVLTEIGAEGRRRLDAYSASEKFRPVETVLSEKAVSNYMDTLREQDLFDPEVEAMVKMVGANSERISRQVRETLGADHEATKACERIHADFKRVRASEDPKLQREMEKMNIKESAAIYGVSINAATKASKQWYQHTPIPEDDGTEDMMEESILKRPVDSVRRRTRRGPRSMVQTGDVAFRPVNLDPGATDVDPYPQDKSSWDAPVPRKREKRTVLPMVSWEEDGVMAVEPMEEEKNPLVPEKNHKYIVVDIESEPEPAPQSLGERSIEPERKISAAPQEAVARRKRETMEDAPLEPKPAMNALEEQPAIQPSMLQTHDKEEEARAADIKKRRLLAMLGRSKTGTRPTRAKFIPENRCEFEGKVVFLPQYVSDGTKNWVKEVHMMTTSENNLALYRQNKTLYTMAGTSRPLAFFVKDEATRNAVNDALLKMRPGTNLVVEIPMALKEK